ncbi:hypothetical protein F511_09603 [Dorcoceras hygrometricum]|uniref:Rab-GAP TBC domain-containing protein n=1 Tax=Dorcoceras hygrometricum TaxID=472368 RepID=A0A2Z7CSU0_9LAMI|nr:hypothetical protein F511_09603 [Dorcoceras hygrometricum]
MSPVPTETTTPETASCSGGLGRFENFRGIRWRMDLGILPSSRTASIDDLRRVTANSRRRYASLRRKLLVDPHVVKDGGVSPDLVMDNPLSQNPDSMWGRFFRNAELERMLDQDLTRLYNERGSYFQTSACQGMLRRILLLWCLKNPEYGYRQGMHELLAPLMYVLHVDVKRLLEVRKLFVDHFADKFDGLTFHEDDTYNFDFNKFSESVEYKNGLENSSVKANGLTELDPEIQTTVLLGDAYGAEGELGVVLSEKFMEHDAYSMFDALMCGADGAVAMAEFFSPSPFVNSHTGFPRVIEASAALYHLLSIADSSLHSHLVELGVEPQYFTLRWLRVLFGREFSLKSLLVIWDEIFSRENTKPNKAAGLDVESNFGVLSSHRGAFISAFAVSMVLYLRSSLLATENATACLQRLLNFPDDINLVKLVTKAASLQALALALNVNSQQIQYDFLSGRKSVVVRGHSLSLDLSSPRTPWKMVHESYWEEQWRVLHKEEESKKSDSGKQVVKSKKGWSERVRLRLSRTESDPSPSIECESAKSVKPSVNRSLLEVLARELVSNEEKESIRSDEVTVHQNLVETTGQNTTDQKLRSAFSGAASEGNSSDYLEPQSPIHGGGDQENEQDRSSVASNSSVDENDVKTNDPELCGMNSSLPVSDPPTCCSPNFKQTEDSIEKSATGAKQIKLLSGKFPWLWKFGRNEDVGVLQRPPPPEVAKTSNSANSGQERESGSVMADGYDGSCSSSHGDTVEQNVMVSLRNLGQSMLENIQMIESALQLDQLGSPENLNGFSSEGRVKATVALNELRNIGNLLSGM